MTAPYIELHAGSAFSFLEGGGLPEEFIGAAGEYNMPAMALLDRDGVYGAPRFHLAAKKAGIQAHIGAEVTSTTGVRYPLLAETQEGLESLRAFALDNADQPAAVFHIYRGEGKK